MSVNGYTIQPTVLHTIKPSNPIEGDMYFNNLENRMYTFYSNTWYKITFKVGIDISLNNSRKTKINRLVK